MLGVEFRGERMRVKNFTSLHSRRSVSCQQLAYEEPRLGARPAARARARLTASRCNTAGVANREVCSFTPARRSQLMDYSRLSARRGSREKYFFVREDDRSVSRAAHLTHRPTRLKKWNFLGPSVFSSVSRLSVLRHNRQAQRWSCAVRVRQRARAQPLRRQHSVPTRCSHKNHLAQRVLIIDESAILQLLSM